MIVRPTLPSITHRAKLQRQRLPRAARGETKFMNGRGFAPWPTSFEALTSDRPYRKALSAADAPRNHRAGRRQGAGSGEFLMLEIDNPAKAEPATGPDPLRGRSSARAARAPGASRGRSAPPATSDATSRRFAFLTQNAARGVDDHPRPSNGGPKSSRPHDDLSRDGVAFLARFAIVSGRGFGPFRPL